MKFEFAVLLLCSLSLYGCAFGGSPRPKTGDLENPKRSRHLDSATQKKSDLIFHFLKGELELNDENFEAARLNFEKAGELVESSDHVLRVQLARLYLNNGDLEAALRENSRALADQSTYDSKLLQASLYHTLGRYDEAKAAYLLCIKQVPKDVVARLFLAHVLYAQKDLDGAITQVRKVVDLQPDTALGFYYLGGLYREQNRLPNSVEALKKAYKLDSDNKKIELSYLYTLLLSKRLKEAKELLDRIPEKWGASNLTVVIKAISNLVEQGRIQEAGQFLIGFIGEEAIDHHELRRHVGILQIEEREFAQAIQNLQLVLTQHADDSKSRYFLGTAFAAIGLKNKSISELQAIKAEDQMYVEAQTFASFLLRQMNKLSEAETAIRNSIAAQSEPDSNLSFFLIDVLRAQRQYSEARDVVEEILEEEPNDEKALFMYGTILEEQGDNREAMSVMERLVTLNPDHSQALNFIAYHLAEESHDLDRALEYSQKALNEYPDDGYFLDTLGWIHYRRGDFKLATEVLARAVNLTGDDPVIIEHYANALLAQGRADKALRLFVTVFNKLADPQTRKEEGVKQRSIVNINRMVASDQTLKKIAESAGYETE